MLNKLRWFQGADPIKKPTKPVEEDVPYELETVFVLRDLSNHSDPLVLMGEANRLPQFELLLNRDADEKGDTSRWRLRIFGGFVLSAAAVASGLRLSKSISVSRGFGKAKRAILAHPS